MVILFGPNVGTKNFTTMFAFTAASWSCGPSAARPGSQCSQVLLLHVSVEFIPVYCTERRPSFPTWNLREGILPRKLCKM